MFQNGNVILFPAHSSVFLIKLHIMQIIGRQRSGCIRILMPLQNVTFMGGGNWNAQLIYFIYYKVYFFPTQKS